MLEEAIKQQEARKQARMKRDQEYEAMTPEERKAADAHRAKERERFERMPLPEDGYEWREEARKLGLDSDEQSVLGRQKFVVGRREFRQSFEPYDYPKGPVFVTSDSLLNIYHVLFEDSFRELEIRRSGQLRAFLETTFTNARAAAAGLPFSSEELQPAWRQAQLAIGPAMRLLGTPSGFFDEPVRSDIEDEVGRIRDAKGTRLPGWLEPMTVDFLAIDYGRLKPVGFYVGSRLLEDYFRAVRWLQLVPFRIERDNEFGAIALLGLNLPTAKSYPHESYLKNYASFLGRPDGRYLDNATHMLPGGFNPVFEKTFQAQLEKARKWFTPSRPLVDDHLRSADGGSERMEPFHLLAGFALPETVLFQKLLGLQKEITGLQFAAINGSAWAYTKLSEKQKAEVLDKTITQDRQASEDVMDESLYGSYRRVIASLFEKPDPDAPAFVASEAWAAKSTQTALASWVQIRHTFTLQAKISMLTLGMHPLPPGFIEPNPAFFRSFVELVRTTRAKLDGFHLFATSALNVANKLNEQADLCDEYVALSKRMSRDELERTVVSAKVQDLLNGNFSEILPDDGETDDVLRRVFEAMGRNELVGALPRFAGLLRSTATQYAQGKIEVVEQRGYRSVETRWAALEELATRMETLLQKQLRRQNWNKEETNFIKRFGGQMAYIMGYFGNAHSPQDDAPRWVEIADFPDRGSLFAVAIGRPRAFYVLYPWHGVEVLCTGAVFPYFEYEGKSRLTDAEWTKSLGRPGAVPLPGWVRTLYANPQ